MSSRFGPSSIEPGVGQASANSLQLLVAGSSLALGATVSGADKLTETSVLSLNGAAQGGILGGTTDVLGETSGVTVV